MNTSEFLSIACAIVPDRTALVFNDIRFTFDQFQTRVNQLADSLASMGIGQGDRIAVMQVNSHMIIEIYFAAAQLDAIFVPINFRARSEELEQMLRIAEPKILFLGDRYVSLIIDSEGNNTQPQIVVMDNPESHVGLIYEQLVSQGNPELNHFPESADTDTTVIMFTAGTTGTPKGVMLTHDSFSSYILSTVTPADPDVYETNLITVPFYHIAGLQAALSAIFGGRTLVIMPQFEALSWLKLAQAEQVNRAMLVPTMLKQLMDHQSFSEYDLTNLAVITYGAAPMPLEVIKQAIGAFPNAQFINAFGQTETASTITMLPPEDHILEGSDSQIEKKLIHLTSIGKPLDDVEVMIVSEEGHPVEQGEIGEIVARGERMMKGYWGQEIETQATIRSGWIYTGDLAYQDEDDYIYLSGRAKDFIKRGGEMISPDEVEQILLSHPQIIDAAVIGIPDLEWGEEVRALVVANKTVESSPSISLSELERELADHCKARLASFKTPTSIVFIEDIPRNVMGKILKRDLRETYGEPINGS